MKAIKELRRELMVLEQPKRKPDPYLVGESDWTPAWGTYEKAPTGWPSPTAGSRG